MQTIDITNKHGVTLTFYPQIQGSPEVNLYTGYDTEEGKNYVAVTVCGEVRAIFINHCLGELEEVDLSEFIY